MLNKSNLWWDQEEDSSDLPETLMDTVTSLLNQDTVRRTMYMKDMSIYNNRFQRNLSVLDEHSTGLLEHSADNPTLNIIRNMVDSVTSKITKNDPRPIVITDGGTSTSKFQTKRLDAYVWGVLQKSGAYQKARLCFRNKAIFGPGIMFIHSEANSKTKKADIKIETVHPWEILIDPIDGAYGTPSSLIRIKYVPKGKLIATYPEFKNDIENAALKGSNVDDLLSSGSQMKLEHVEDMVLTMEAYRLKIGNTIGRHVIAIQGQTLVDDVWERETFPFIFQNWNNPIMGFWGRGLVHESKGLQSEINELMNKISNAHYYHAIPTIAVVKGSTDLKDFDNALEGRILQVNKQENMPKQITPSVLSPEVYTHLDRLYQRIYEDAGVSQLAAQSKKPVGLDSGIAIREFNDIESDRFSLHGKAYEQLFIELANQIMDESGELDAAGFKLEVVAEDMNSKSDSLIRIDWKKAKMKRDSVVFKVFPISALPSQPSAKLATIQSLFGSGLISDKTKALSLLGIPDLSNDLELETAGLEAAKMHMDKLFEKQAFIPIDVYQDLPHLLSVATQTYNLGLVRGYSQLEFSLIRKTIDRAKELIIKKAKEDQALAAQVQPQQPQQAAPQTKGLPPAPPAAGAAQ